MWQVHRQLRVVGRQLTDSHTKPLPKLLHGVTMNPLTPALVRKHPDACVALALRLLRHGAIAEAKEAQMALLQPANFGLDGPPAVGESVQFLQQTAAGADVWRDGVVRGLTDTVRIERSDPSEGKRGVIISNCTTCTIDINGFYEAVEIPQNNYKPGGSGRTGIHVYLQRGTKLFITRHRDSSGRWLLARQLHISANPRRENLVLEAEHVGGSSVTTPPTEGWTVTNRFVCLSALGSGTAPVMTLVDNRKTSMRLFDSPTKPKVSVSDDKADLINVHPRHVRRSNKPLIGDEIEFSLALGMGNAKRFYCKVTDVSIDPPNKGHPHRVSYLTGVDADEWLNIDMKRFELKDQFGHKVSKCNLLAATCHFGSKCSFSAASRAPTTRVFAGSFRHRSTRQSN